MNIGIAARSVDAGGVRRWVRACLLGGGRGCLRSALPLVDL